MPVRHLEVPSVLESFLQRLAQGKALMSFSSGSAQ